MKSQPTPQPDFAKQGLQLQAGLAALGIALTLVFVFGGPGFPDVKLSPAWLTATAVLYVAFCALEAWGAFLALTKNGRVQGWAVRVIVSILIAFALGWLQLVPFLVLLLIWPLWIITLLAWFGLTVVKLRKLRQQR